MPNSIKFFIFSMVGFVIFTVVSIFFPFLSFVSLGFGCLSDVSLIVYLFEKITTRHHFLLSAISFVITAGFLWLIHYIFAVSGVSAHSEIITVMISETICQYGSLYSVFFFLVCLLILGFDFLLSFTAKLSKERKNVFFKWFRFSVYCFFFVTVFAAAVEMIPDLQAVLQVTLLMPYISILISIYMLLFKQMQAKGSVKLVIANTLCALSAAVLCGYVLYSGDAAADLLRNQITLQGTFGETLFNTAEIGVLLFSRVIFLAFVISLLIQMLICMFMEMFSPKRSFLKCFIPILYAAFGLLISGVMHYYSELTPFYFPILSKPFYISMMVYAVGVAASFMTAAYKIIFVKGETVKVEKINIDIED